MKKLLALLILLLPMRALALGGTDAAPAINYASQADGCISYKMCVAQSGLTACDTVGDGTGNPIVLRLGSQTALASAITFFAARSTATTYTCAVNANDEGYNAASAAGDGSQITGAALSNTTRLTSISGAPLDAIWISCSGSISGGTVTINALVCPATR